jgi:NADH-quinone oxidoreductase subunit N
MNVMNLAPAYPEIILLMLTLGILAVDMYLPQTRRRVTWLLSLAAIVICAGFSFRLAVAHDMTYTFGGAFVSDPVGNLLKLFTCLVMFVTLLYSRRYIDERGMTGGFIGGEFYVLALFCLLGQMIVISGANLLVLYLGIELMSLPLYALVAMRRHDARVSEAAIKYFILGMLGSGFLLYGISMLYGATGILDIREVAQACMTGDINKTVLVFGVVFVVSGMAFKLGVAPFHMWVPDVYDGAPTAVTLLIGGAPKLAGFAIFLRVLVEGLFPLATDWQQMLVVLSVFSMAIGNITALVQTSIKRMLAYSTIGQMGFMLLGLLSGAADSTVSGLTAGACSSALFYTIIYVLAVLGAFGMVLMLSRAGYEAERLDDFRGLNRRNPWHAFVMMMFMLSLAGIPPLAGFYAKLSVLEALVASGRIWLAVVAIILSVVGAFYYLRVVKLMYFDEPVVAEDITAPRVETVVLGINMAAVLLPGVLPGFLMGLCHHAVVRTLVL